MTKANSKQLHEMEIAEIQKFSGNKAAAGLLSKIGDKYYITLDSKKIELDKSKLVSSDPIEHAVDEKGVNVSVLLGSDSSSILAIIFKQTSPTIKRRPILCYKPIVDILHRLDLEVQTSILKTMIIEGTMTPVLGKQLLREITT